MSRTPRWPRCAKRLRNCARADAPFPGGGSMKRSEDRLLTTHVGSIPRPRAMLDMASALTGPPKDPAAYAELVRSLVADIVKRQAAAGIDIINDGEYGKSSWANYVLERVTGFETRAGEQAPMVWLGRDRER